MELASILAAMLATALLADRAVRPRARGRGRSAAGTAMLALMTMALFGGFLALSGHVIAAALFASLLVAALALVSNAKNAVLGEPLLFSDLALLGAVFRHPQFYVSALHRWQILLLGGGAVLLVALLAAAFVPAAAPHVIGGAVAAAALAALWLLQHLAPIAVVPDTHANVGRHGLLPTLLLHGLEWRRATDPPPCTAPPVETDISLIVIVQCESFADPVELYGDAALALPGLARARAGASRWGKLLVSGFGAYTMRTEYGVLFGRSEAELGFRRFDPFLTAIGEASHALPARLGPKRWRRLFVHPHDMRFYGRDRIMPAAGFDELIGEAGFPPPGAGEGRYVSDAAITDRIIALAGAARTPMLIHAVTIENHGPWPPGPASDAQQQGAWLPLVRRSDAMLTALADALQGLGRPALLVFYGDHRPSIPGVSMPGGERHTPYVILRFHADAGSGRSDGGPQDLTPAELHHAILAELAR
ncbi:hypothetical protein GCM10007973_23450 [Polymorphobacter multimanifer]|uniref:Sulfatase N-terminal domain-containing protein n=1 Tax=Polymorphobacter multimanifer TaxID=1070431 RepID=A0A841L7W3_9SPHN|nr:LTA synthase family protein [Polymorphobacter multimanifer]MBB6228296.1 hypothetical protein [Polymorphobacter multimanifer]GGI86214.1 hypothetical protein GCM10007973_23450 [Polymorphobacter multimanifer]